MTPVLVPVFRLIRLPGNASTSQITLSILTEEGLPLLTEEAALIQTEPN